MGLETGKNSKPGVFHIKMSIATHLKRQTLVYAHVPEP